MNYAVCRTLVEVIRIAEKLHKPFEFTIPNVSRVKPQLKIRIKQNKFAKIQHCKEEFYKMEVFYIFAGVIFL